MTIRLRSHHLLCLMTYVGKGYSPAFSANLEAIALRIAEGEAVLIVAGADDVCRPLLGDPDAHCHGESVAERDRLAASDVGRLLRCPIVEGTTMVLEPERLAALRQAFAAGLTRRACLGCEWSDLCTQVSDGGYAGTLVPHRLVPQRIGGPDRP